MKPQDTDTVVEDSRSGQGPIATRNDQSVPATLDPAVTMELVQRYVESERSRSRRALVWISTGFLFVILLVFIVFVSLGVIVLGNTRRTEEKVKMIGEETKSHAVQVAGVAGKLGSLEGKQEQVRIRVEGQEIKRGREDQVLKSDLERFSRYVADLNAKEQRSLSKLEIRLKELDETVVARDKELKEIKTWRAAAAASSGQGSVPGSAQYETSDSAIEKLADIPDLSMEEKPADNEPVPPKVEHPRRGEISVVTYPNGDRYEGEFKDGLHSGWGAYYYRNGDTYEGDFRSDMKHGKGTFTYRNGDKYIGDFKSDMKEGRGTFMFPDGDRYIGEFKDDVICGKGSMLYKNGNKYAGDFRNGLKSGNGVFSFSNGDTYKGEFRNDLRNGRGIYMFTDGTKYIGEFKDGQRHGKGRYTYAGGEEYVGEFKAGKKDGNGECIYPNGKRLKGLWKDDKLVRVFEE